MTTQCVYTHTPPGQMPPYLNVTRLESGDYRITVRSAATHDVMQSDDPPLASYGPTATIELSEHELYAMAAAIVAIRIE